MITESQVERSFRRLLKNETVTPDVLDRAEELLDDLRPESPLRHRLYCELDELRSIHAAEE